MQYAHRYGSRQNVVDANLVEKKEYLGRNVTLEGFNGFNASQPLGKVWIEMGKHRLHHGQCPGKNVIGYGYGHYEVFARARSLTDAGQRGAEAGQQ